VVAVASDETGLPARFAAGEPDAVRGVYQRYGGLVYSVAYKVLGDAGLAEDATQQTFVQAWRAATTYDPDRSIDAWLASIARRAAIDVYRRERRHRGTETIESAEPALVTTPPSVDQLSDVWEVRRAVEQLPDQDRELVRLQHYGELTHAEIANQLDIPLGTVKSRSFRAHRRLASLLGHLRVDADRSTGQGGTAMTAVTGEDEKGRSDERR
jgi:RNA polymerase sigma-70 factor (ECF subfamily)